MRQQLVIRLIPVEVTLFAVLVGWITIALVHGLVASPLVESVSAPVRPAAPAAGQESQGISPVFTPEVRFWAPRIVAWAEQAGLDPDLVATVMQIESCGDPQAVSISGAQGLFQVMPFHFAEDDAMQDPDTNALHGLEYLAIGFARAGGQVGPALAGYNGGHSQIGKAASLWPAETQRYHYWGTGIYEAAASGASASDRLQEWLDAGGESLCRQAARRLELPD